MKKKVFSVIFITACLLCCVIPFVGMIVAPSNEAIGNEQQQSFRQSKPKTAALTKSIFNSLAITFQPITH